MSENNDIEKLESEEKLTRLGVVKYPNSYLHKPASSLLDFTDINGVIKNLFYTMKMEGAIGIAAPSVSIKRRIIVMNINKPLVMINPVIITNSKETESFEESGLSFKGFFYSIDRHTDITVAYQDEFANFTSITLTGISAAVAQHEIDIIDGIMFYDRYSVLKKFFARKKLNKFIKQL